MESANQTRETANNPANNPANMADIRRAMRRIEDGITLVRLAADLAEHGADLDKLHRMAEAIRKLA